MNSFNTSRRLCLMLQFTVVGTLLVTTQIESVAQDQTTASEIQRAVGMLQGGDASGAEAILRDITENDESNARAWYLLGFTLHTQQKYSEAVEIHRKAAEFEVTRPRATYNLACALAQTGKTEAAFKALATAIELGAVDRTSILADADLVTLRNDERFTALVPPPLAEDELFVEPTEILHMWYGENANDEFGWVARRIGDIDGDDVQDFVATAPSFGSGAGKIYVYSSQSGALKFSRAGQAGARLGNGAAGAGDVNRDGIPDVVVGAPRNQGDSNRGAAFVYSGKDGEVLHQFQGRSGGDQFGYKVCGIGDIDADGHADVAIGAISGNGDQSKSGVVYGFSGKTGEELFQLNGESAGDKFGSALAGWEGAPSPMLIVGAQDAGEGDRGQALVYGFDNGEVKELFRIEPDSTNVSLGQMFASFPGDFDNDQIPDVYVSDFSSSASGPSTGSIYVHSGATGKRLLQIDGTQPGEGFGTSPSDAGDVNNDGVGDLVVGAWQNREGARSGGKVSLYSGADGELIRAWTCRESGDTFGFDAIGIGDVNGDGAVDFLLTSAWSSAKAPKAGRVMILSGSKSSE